MSKNTISDNKLKQPIKEISSQDKMISGSAWMTGASILSRLLGALYIIPWMAWMGNPSIAASANALYIIGYTPYALFLNIATAGVPSAIAKQVSYYNSLNEYEVSRNIYKKGLQIMAVTGVVSALIMYFAAPFVAASSPSISVEDGTQVIRSLSWALLIIPCMSVTRGYIQGHHIMKYSAISQFIEQLARVIFMLAAVYLIRKTWNGSVVSAVSASTFAAVIGAVFSIGYLFYVIWRKKPELDKHAAESLNKVTISTNEIFKSIIRTAVPFIIIGSGITLFQMIDQFTFQQIMTRVSDFTPKEIVDSYGVASGNVNKLIMIVISFGGSMAITSVPLISELMAKNDLKKLTRQVSDSLQLFFFIMLPATIGMAVVAEPLYTVFYEQNAFGTELLQVASFMSLFLGLFVLMGSTMQAANQTRSALLALAIGLAVKLATQYPMLAWAGTNGMFISNIFGFGITVLLMLRKMYKVTHFDIGLILRRVLLMLILTLAMASVTFAVKELLYLVMDSENRTSALLVMAISAGSGGMVYLYASLKTRLADRLIGSRVASLRTKLRIK
ncbi:putative polysaccharide biosynthesis protein [Carnobacterium pleistocenium]|uniref:putative polysaccharide biosynthesis protein n=1 Tax=Carnobacterium pleistocenium TaxID=181073 RepID=UPI0005563303|nr:polysaccharide biosynthesis protein [Carnobacterium pleistocenium]